MNAELEQALEDLAKATRTQDRRSKKDAHKLEYVKALVKLAVTQEENGGLSHALTDLIEAAIVVGSTFGHDRESLATIVHFAVLGFPDYGDNAEYDVPNTLTYTRSLDNKGVN